MIMIDEKNFLEFLVEAYSKNELGFYLEIKLIDYKQYLIRDYDNEVNKYVKKHELSEDLKTILRKVNMIRNEYLDDLFNGILGIAPLKAICAYLNKEDISNN
ncbi:MAG: hypothetical protein ABIB43_06950 [archaeon]